MTLAPAVEVVAAVGLVGLAAAAGALGRGSIGGPPATGAVGRARALPVGRRWGPVIGSGVGSAGGEVRPRGRLGPAHWATRGALRPLLVGAATPGRLALGLVPPRSGRVPGGRRPGGGLPRWPGTAMLAAEPSQSVAVIGPTQSGKTTGLAIPAILGWEGPVVAASVKTDLLRDTIGWRRRCGRVWCFDPARTTAVPPSGWSPVTAATSWSAARRIASDLTEVARGPATTADGEFWYATAAKLLAPLLYAAAASGAGVADVVRWVETQEVDEVLAALEGTDCPEALQAARATWLRDERQRSAVYTTAETVLEPFADHLAAGAARGQTTGDIDPRELLSGPHTLYLCAPAHDQRRLRPLFVAVVKQVVETAFARSSRLGRPLDPPLLLVLDEAAHIAPLAELDGLAATCAGHGVQLVTVWQDLAQVRARYGDRAATVVNNHRAKLFLSGTSDPVTLDHASHLVGEEEVWTPSVAWSATGDRSVTTAPVRRRLLAPDALRRMAPGTGVLVYGSLPPVCLRLRPWFDDPDLRHRGRATGDDREAGAAGRRRPGRRDRPRPGSGRRRGLPSRRWQQTVPTPWSPR